MNRFFAFGCSFTNYWRWPTWADAVGRQAAIYENWGVCGGGNGLIFNSLIECNQRWNLRESDVVAIMWTNTSREDRYVGRRWLGQGNVYWGDGSALPYDYIKKFACERGYLIRDLAYIAAAKNLLESWRCQYKFFSMVPLSLTNQDAGLGFNPEDSIDQDSDVRTLYSEPLSCIEPSVFEVIFKGDWDSKPGIPDSYDPKRRDFHPTPTEHLDYLAQVWPDMPLTHQTRNWMFDLEYKIRNGEQAWRQPVPKRRL